MTCYAEIDAKKVHKACKEWLLADQEKYDNWKQAYIEEQCSKRRFFGLLPPQKVEDFLVEQEEDIWSEINLRNSLSRASPNTEILALMDLASVAIKTGQSVVKVDSTMAKYLNNYF